MKTTKQPNGKNLIEQAYDRILCLISEGKLRPSEIISHRFLAEELKVSKQPICIALQRLEDYGIVESLPRIGTKIRQVTAQDMWGMLQWRLSLEMRTITLACEYCTEEQLKKLSAMAGKLDNRIQNPEDKLDQRKQNDMAFHLEIAEAADCPRLWQELSKLNIYYLKSTLCEAVSVSREDIPNKAYITHKNLVDAIQRHDIEKAPELMKQHIELSQEMRRFTEWYKSSKKSSR